MKTETLFHSISASSWDFCGTSGVWHSECFLQSCKFCWNQSRN